MSKEAKCMMCDGCKNLSVCYKEEPGQGRPYLLCEKCCVRGEKQYGIKKDRDYKPAA